MEASHLRKIRKTMTESKEDLAKNLGHMLVEMAGETLTVRKARDGLSAVLKRAREGSPQIIGNVRDAAVVISVKDLAALLGDAREPTLAEALEGSGFSPYRGGHITIGERRSREPLKRRGEGARPGNSAQPKMAF